MNCDNCGVCCRTLPVYVSEADAELEPQIRAHGIVLAEHLRKDDWVYQLFPLPFQDRCSFQGPDNRCTIYETRPRVCRDFPAGDPQCQQNRAHHGLPPLK